MTSEQFNVIMPIISSDIVKTISARKNISESESISLLYSSELYSMLEREDTKLWHYSTPMLYSMLEEEWNTGKITYPDV